MFKRVLLYAATLAVAFTSSLVTNIKFVQAAAPAVCTKDTPFIERKYQDANGHWWICKETRNGKFVWFNNTSPISPVIVCDEDHVGHVWYPAGGPSYYECLPQLDGSYKWVPIKNPFADSPTQPQATRKSSDVVFTWAPPTCVADSNCTVTGYKLVYKTITTTGFTTKTLTLPATSRVKTITNITYWGAPPDTQNNLEVSAHVIALYNNNTVESNPEHFQDVYLGNVVRSGQMCESSTGGWLANCDVYVTDYTGDKLLGNATGYVGQYGYNDYCIAQSASTTTWKCWRTKTNNPTIYYDGSGNVDASWAAPDCLTAPIPCPVKGYYAKVESTDTGEAVYAPSNTSYYPSAPLPPTTFNAVIDISASSIAGTMVHVSAGTSIGANPDYFQEACQIRPGQPEAEYKGYMADWSSTYDVFAG